MEKYFLAALQSVSGIGSMTLKHLLEYFGTAEQIWHASLDELKASTYLTQRMLDKFLQYRQNFDVERLFNECQTKQIKLATIFDAEYPELLKNIYDPPMALFYQGSLQIKQPLAIVGARHFSPYGKNVALLLAEELAARGATIVSGAAYGIDTFAHEGALRSNGQTIAVLGCGVDIAYPRENKKLLEKITQNGAVISEYLPGTRPLANFFPARNRIISGIAQGTVVVEATKKSGSLITAEFALNEGRDVFAVPGSIYAQSSTGCNYLIQQGAKLVTAASDILIEYNDFKGKAPTKPKKALTAEEQKIYDILSYEQGISTDELVYKLRTDISNISFVVLQMKLQGLVEEMPNGTYVLSAKE